MDKKKDPDEEDSKTEKDETKEGETEREALTSNLDNGRAGKQIEEADNDLTKTEENALNKMRRQRSQYSNAGDELDEEATHMELPSSADKWEPLAPDASDPDMDGMATTTFINGAEPQPLDTDPRPVMGTTISFREPDPPRLDTKLRPPPYASIEDNPNYRAPAELGDIELHDMERTGPPPEDEVEAYECTRLCWLNCVGTMVVRFYQQLCTAHSTFSRTKRILGIIALVIIACLVVFCGIFSSSFEYINYYHVALRQSRLTGSVDRNRVLYPGCYVLGPDVDLIYFSSTAHTISAKVSVFTKDKMVIDVDLSLQYFLRPNEVGKVHAMFGKDYHSVFESLVFNTIKNEGTKHPLAMYRKSRPKMERDFHHKVRERLGGTCCPSCCPNECSNKTVCAVCEPAGTCDAGYHVDVEYFQMGKISIPNEVFERLMRQTILQIESEREVFYQQHSLEVKETLRLTEQISNQAAETRANATAYGKTLGLIAVSDKEKVIQTSYIKALKGLYSRLNVVQEDHKLSLMMMLAYEDIKDNLYTSLNASSLFLNT
ncbi:uncharacterized protein [Haliotis cracherodii]|uniref:uncharacterized protein isoform X1 n=1 Tax=Haliotis cracherodii TaxID=6455 RepID=UPI0039EB8CD6